jgi:septal ring factor EnvC (AmiA/AmiB activator)
MDSIIQNLETGLKDQLKSLGEQIKVAEESLIRTKEGYLKVQGALEIMEILKKELSDQEIKALSEGEV